MFLYLWWIVVKNYRPCYTKCKNTVRIALRRREGLQIVDLLF